LPGASQTRIDARLRRRHLTIDVLVNNAGVVAHGPFVGMTAQDQQQVIDLNVSGLTAMQAATMAGRATPRWLPRRIVGAIGRTTI
jgi:short-subunit dehydrogenase